MFKKYSVCSVLFIAAFFCLFMAMSIPDVSAQEAQKTDSTWNDWKFRISPYYWFIGLEGTIYSPPRVVNYPIPPPPKFDIDVGFKDIRNSIKFALMLAGQYKSKHLVAQFNYSALILESEAITPYELILQDNIINLTYMAGDLGIGYRVIKNPKFEFDVLLGLKFLYVNIGLKTNIVGKVEVKDARGNFWGDPALGINLKYIPFKKLEFTSTMDYGPPFLDDVNSYQVLIGASYLFTRTFHTTLGYRLYHVDFPVDRAIFNGNVKGFYLKLGFQF